MKKRSEWKAHFGYNVERTLKDTKRNPETHRTAQLKSQF